MNSTQVRSETGIETHFGMGVTSAVPGSGYAEFIVREQAGKPLPS